MLTRAFYAGSQRFGAMWTGDNLGTWRHLQSTVPMLLTSGIAGMTFAGCQFTSLSPALFRWQEGLILCPFLSF